MRSLRRNRPLSRRSPGVRPGAVSTLRARIQLPLMLSLLCPSHASFLYRLVARRSRRDTEGHRPSRLRYRKGCRRRTRAHCHLGSLAKQRADGHMSRGLPFSKKVGPGPLGGPWTLECCGPGMFGGQTQPGPFWPRPAAQKCPQGLQAFPGAQTGAALPFIRTLIGILIASSLSVFCVL